MYVAVQQAIAGNPLYFTGSDNYTLINTPYVENSKRFPTAEAASAAISDWNRMNNRYVVREATAEEMTNIRFLQPQSAAIMSAVPCLLEAIAENRPLTRVLFNEPYSTKPRKEIRV